MLPQNVSHCSSMHQPWPLASSLSNQKQLPQHFSSNFAIRLLEFDDENIFVQPLFRAHTPLRFADGDALDFLLYYLLCGCHLF